MSCRVKIVPRRVREPSVAKIGKKYPPFLFLNLKRGDGSPSMNRNVTMPQKSSFLH